MYSSNNLVKSDQDSKIDTPSSQNITSEETDPGSESPGGFRTQPSRSRAFELNEDDEAGESGGQDIAAESVLIAAESESPLWPLGSKIPDLDSSLPSTKPKNVSQEGLLQREQTKGNFPMPQNPTFKAWAPDKPGLDDASAKLPHGFMSPLEKRLQGVLTGTEKLPGYNDATVKRTFAEAHVAFTSQGFRQNMDKERRVEVLVSTFRAAAAKALQDDAVLNRHVALFVGLVSSTLKECGEDEGRPELMRRLEGLEQWRSGY